MGANIVIGTAMKRHIHRHLKQAYQRPAPAITVHRSQQVNNTSDKFIAGINNTGDH